MSRDRWRRTRAVLLRAIVPLLGCTFATLPLPAAQRIGAGTGRLAWLLSQRDRRRALDHLAIAFPELGERERRALGKASFRHLGITLTECLHLLGRQCEDVERYVAVEGWENIERARAAGRPVLVLTGHCGNWELLAASINCRGLEMSVIARRADEPELDQTIVDLRARFGTRTINRAEPGAARELLRALRDRGALGMLIDQDTRVKGVWVPFFSRPAYTPTGAAELALKRDAAVIPSFIARLPDGSHRAHFHPPLELAAEVERATAQMTALIERQIRLHPEQWVWMHRRWRRRPGDEIPTG